MSTLALLARVVIVGLIVFAFAGCGEPYRIDPLIRLRGEDDDKKPPQPLDLDRMQFREDIGVAGAPTAYARAAASVVERNRLQAILLAHSDRIYAHHVSDVLGFRSGLDSSLDLAATITAGIGALTTGGTTPNVLSGSAAMLNAGSSQIHSDIYQRLFVPAIVRKTEEGRAQIAASMARKRRQPLNVYTVDDMIADLMEYHRRGSFFYGVMALAEPEPEK
jgi:hypothetical protein